MSTSLRRLAALASLLAVALPGAAQAKGLTALTVCGADGCVDRSAAVRPHARLVEGMLEAGDSVSDPGAAPFVRFKEHLGDGTEEFGMATVVYFPTLGIQRFEDGTFDRVSPELRRALRGVVGGVRPLPASALKPTEVAPYAAPETAAPAQATGAAAGGPPPAGGGDVPTSAWVGGAGVAAAVIAALLMFALRRRGSGPSGRPATG
ncbi:MAG TPA: hypothetical protein VNT03_03890 [Baekduia sp.]|nr:hypothetical protein [Baekduia sp.]